MDWKLHFLRCFVIVNSIAFCAVLAQDRFFASSREWGRYIGAIAICSMTFLLLFSFLCFRHYRRTAAIGFAVATATFILGLLSPEL
jgi:hypothetical protein